MPRRRTGRPRGRPRKIQYMTRPVRIYKKRTMLQNEPNFTETIKKEQITASPAGTLGVFKIRISDIAEFVSDYANLYTQYRINWVKVMLLPQYLPGDHNTAGYNQSIGIGYTGMARITYAIQNSPNVGIPASETEILEDNGAKIKPLGKYFKVSFKPVPDVAQSNSAGNPVPTKQYRKQWFNYVGFPNDPEHGAIQYCITEPGLGNQTKFDVYMKVNFSLRDPK